MSAVFQLTDIKRGENRIVARFTHMSTPKELIEKATKGEVDKEELQTRLDEFTDDEKLEFSSLAKSQSEEILSEFSGLTKEKQRRLQQLEELEAKAGEGAPSPEPAQQEPTQFDQFRSEQVLKAKQRLKQQFELSDEDVAKIEEKFERVDSGKMDADLIYEDFVGAYAFVNRDSLLSAQQKTTDMQKRAAQETMNAAGSSSSNPSADNDTPEYPEDVKQLARDAGISEEAAQKQLSGGMRRTY